MVRDITARVRALVNGYCAIFSKNETYGAFSLTLENNKPVANVGNFTNKSERDMYENVYLDSNIGTKETNPMYGHANGGDIHPYSIYLVPLITY